MLVEECYVRFRLGILKMHLTAGYYLDSRLSIRVVFKEVQNSPQSSDFRGGSWPIGADHHRTQDNTTGFGQLQNHMVDTATEDRA